MNITGRPSLPPLPTSKEWQRWPSQCLSHRWLSGRSRAGGCCSSPGLDVANWPACASRQLKGTFRSPWAPANFTYVEVLGQQLHSIHCMRALGQPRFFIAKFSIQAHVRLGTFCWLLHSPECYCCAWGQESGSVKQQPFQLIPKTPTGRKFSFHLGKRN